MLPASLVFARAAATDAAARTSTSGLRSGTVQQPHHVPAPGGRRRSFSSGAPAAQPASTPPSSGTGEWGGLTTGGAVASYSAAAVRRQSLDAVGAAARRASADLGRRPSLDGGGATSGSGRTPIPFDVPDFLPNVSLKSEAVSRGRIPSMWGCWFGQEWRW